MCISKRINQGKVRENIISIHSLYANALLPTQKFTRTILNPFEKNMNNIPNISWSYMGKRPKNKMDFMKAKINVNWKDYPNFKKK